MLLHGATLYFNKLQHIIDRMKPRICHVQKRFEV